MSSEEAGTLTPEIIDRSLNEFWNGPRRGPHRFRGLLSLLNGDAIPEPRCEAVVFAPDDALIRAVKVELIVTGTPVHPRDAPYLGPVQGPAPLACARDPHPDSLWHWDGRGTWFR